jgi:hypothetical protein
MTLKVDIKKTGNDTTLIFAGPLDENCQLPDMSKGYQGRLIIDLGGLTALNSLGCRKWVLWIKEITSKNGGFLRNCSPNVINQINVLSGFVPELMKVESFYVPYACEKCGHEERILLTRGQEFGPKKISVADKMPCHKCGGTMEMDVVKDRYFNFVMRESA